MRSTQDGTPDRRVRNVTVPFNRRMTATPEPAKPPFETIYARPFAVYRDTAIVVDAGGKSVCDASHGDRAQWLATCLNAPLATEPAKPPLTREQQQERREEIAEMVHQAMRFDRLDKTFVWTWHGNSFAQDHARQCADAIISRLNAPLAGELTEEEREIERLLVQAGEASHRYAILQERNGVLEQTLALILGHTTAASTPLDARLKRIAQLATGAAQ